MAIDGLIILDANGRPIIQSGYTSFPPAYPLLHIDALNNELAKAPSSGIIDPVVYVSSGGGGDMPDCSACCHIQVREMRMLASISGDLDPLVAFAFLQAFHDILQDYFGTVSTVTIKGNFDTVYQLIEEILDSSGHPLTTSPSILRDIVLPPSLLSTLLASLPSSSSAGRSAGPTSLNNTGGAFASPIPWRKVGVRHNSNEILFDVTEDMRAIVGRNGTTLASNVIGTIECSSRLSGMPDLLVSFSNPNVMVECAFHPCVRLQRWKREQTLSFIPPDGNFGALWLRLQSRMMKSMENVKIEWYLGEDAIGAQCTLWEIPTMHSSGSRILRGSWTSKAQVPRPAHAFQVRFELPSHSFSSLKIDQVRLFSELYKMYKGVRMQSCGSIEWRW
ncbi:clathrin adaptor mu subunit [Pisolithus thermaeus]|nr:clathrin adaptor mu subunit [Pisolithus thermaeus]